VASLSGTYLWNSGFEGNEGNEGYADIVALRAIRILRAHRFVHAIRVIGTPGIGRHSRPIHSRP
jgi:hypothetical protein